jgi:hypothetical protein
VHRAAGMVGGALYLTKKREKEKQREKEKRERERERERERFQIEVIYFCVGRDARLRWEIGSGSAAIVSAIGTGRRRCAVRAWWRSSVRAWGGGAPYAPGGVRRTGLVAELRTGLEAEVRRYGPGGEDYKGPHMQAGPDTKIK